MTDPLRGLGSRHGGDLVRLRRLTNARPLVGFGAISIRRRRASVGSDANAQTVTELVLAMRMGRWDSVSRRENGRTVGPAKENPMAGVLDNDPPSVNEVLDADLKIPCPGWRAFDQFSLKLAVIKPSAPWWNRG